MDEPVYKVVTLLRQVAFLVLVYSALGWVVERNVQNPESKVKAFFRILCSPLTGPVSRLLPPGTSYGRILSIGVAGTAAVWLMLIVLTEVLRRS
jgi:hypothetical protein